MPTLRGEQAWRHEVERRRRWPWPRGGPSASATPAPGCGRCMLGADRRSSTSSPGGSRCMAEDRPGIPRLEDVPSAPDLFVRVDGRPGRGRLPQRRPPAPGQARSRRRTQIRDALSTRPDEEAVRAVAGDHRERSPWSRPPAGWEVPALLAWSGAERDDIGGAEHLSVLHFWHEAYGADLVAMGMDQLECLVGRAPDRRPQRVRARRPALRLLPGARWTTWCRPWARWPPPCSAATGSSTGADAPAAAARSAAAAGFGVRRRPLRPTTDTKGRRRPSSRRPARPSGPPWPAERWSGATPGCG